MSIETLTAKRLNPSGRRRRPEDGEVGLGRRPQVVERVQHAKGALGDERAPILAHAAHHLRHPDRVAREQLVVFRGTQVAHDPPLDDQVVDDLLRLGLGERALAQVALEVDVPEGGQPPGGHRRAVLLLDRGEVAEVGPLHRLAGIVRRLGDVEAVVRRHLLQLLEGADLLGEFLAQADHVLGGVAIVQLQLLALLVLDQEVDAVEGDAAIVADDPAAAVGIGQAGDDARGACRLDVGRVGIEDAVVMGLAILGEDLADALVRLVAIGLEARRHHPPAAERHDRPLQRRVGLQADDDLVLLVDVARRVRQDARGNLRDVEDALLALLREQRLQGLPDALGALGGAGQELAVAFVGGVVALDEVANVDLLRPMARLEAAPCGSRLLAGEIRRGGHACLLRSKWTSTPASRACASTEARCTLGGGSALVHSPLGQSPKRLADGQRRGVMSRSQRPHSGPGRRRSGRTVNEFRRA